MTKSIDRRSLIRWGAGGLALGTTAFFPRNALSAAPASVPAGTTVPKLVILFLRGGMDAIGAIVPDGDSQYNTTLRPTLYLGPTDPGDGYYSRSLAAGPGGNTFARAHPGYSSLVEGPGNPYSAGDCLFMHLMGFVGQSRSHFVDQQVTETTKVGEPTDTQGWITRLGEVLGFNAIGTPTYNPLGGVSVSPTLQMVVSGSPAMTHVPSIAAYSKDPNQNPYYDTLYDRLRLAYEQNPSAGHTWDQLARETGLATIDSLAQVDPLAPYVPATNWTGFTPGHNFPSTPQHFTDLGLSEEGSAYLLFGAARDATQLLKETSARVVCIQDASYDTHGQEKYLLWDRLKFQSHALRSMYEECINDTSPGNQAQDTTFIVVSEFGRTSEENGSKGTDHGKGGLITLLGPRAKGGVRNCDSAVWGNGQNTLFGDGSGTSHYPVHFEDFRTVYAEISRRLFGIRNIAGGTAYLDYVVDGYSTLGLPGFPYYDVLT